MKTRIFDCFTYFNEDILLEFRLKYLSPLVDIFVVVESSATHSGQSKSFGALNVIQSLSPEIAQKVRLIEVSDYPTAKFEMVKGEAHWERERYQRDCILRGLFDLNHEADYILISDLDEIPNISLIH